MFVVNLGTKSALKSYAVSSMFSDFYVSPRIASSEVPSQPVGLEQTVKGARNRALATTFNDGSSKAMSLGIENGVQYDSETQRWVDFCVVYIKYCSFEAYAVGDTTVPIPLDYEPDRTQRETWGENLQKKGIVEVATDPHKDITGVSRVNQIRGTIQKLINSLLDNNEQFKENLSIVSFKGIDTFVDINCFLYAGVTNVLVDSMVLLYKIYFPYTVENLAIGMIDARGFIFGSMLAERLGAPSFMVRKANKLPNAVTGEVYTKEYQENAPDQLAINDYVQGKNVVLVDDILATGGTFTSAQKLLESRNNKVIAGLFLIAYKQFNVISTCPILSAKQM